MSDDQQIREIVETVRQKIRSGGTTHVDAVRAAIREHKIEKRERGDCFTLVMDELGRFDDSTRPPEIHPPRRRF